MKRQPIRRSTAGLLTFLIAALAAVGASSCGKTSPPADSFSADLPRGWMTLVLRRIQAEKMNPPQASRIFAYTGVALYEGAVPGMKGRRSLAGQLKGLGALPAPVRDRVYDWPTAQSAAVERVLGKLFANSPGSLGMFASYYGAQIDARRASGVSKDVSARSLELGIAIGDAIISWSAADQFDWTRQEPFKVPTDPALWVPTGTAVPKQPPAEPYWGNLRSFVLKDRRACAPPPPVPFSQQPGSPFHKEATAVYQVSRSMTDEQRAIARHWADNPGQSSTPPGHWMAILTELLAKRSLADAAEAYALAGIAAGEAFISCWQTKYTYNVLRPETYIRRHIEKDWSPALVTPLFPEYTSGHAVSSGAIATVLTALFGDIGFTDETKVDAGLRTRRFASFNEAAEEAAASRVFGGIHYPMASTNGLAQGRCIGAAVLDAVRTSGARRTPSKSDNLARR